MSRQLVLVMVFAAACAGERLRRDANRAFQQGAYEEALKGLEQAVKEDPGNLELRIELRRKRDAAVQQLLATGDAARSRNDPWAAAEAYQRAVALEPGNDRAHRGLAAVRADARHGDRTAKAAQLLAAKQADSAEQEVRGVLAEDPGYAPALALLAKIEAARGPALSVPRLRTRDEHAVTLQFRDAPTKMVFEVLARQTGLNFIFDKDVKSDGKTTIFVNQVPVEQAIDVILAQNQLGRQVLSDNIVLVYPNTPAKQKDYRDEIVHTFYLTNVAPKDAESMLKTVLAAKTLFVDEHSSTLVMRDTPEHVRMAEKLVASVDVAEPEVILELEVLEVTHSLLEQLGINYPSSVSFSATKPPDSNGSVTLNTAGGQGLVLSDLAKQNKNTIAVSSLGVSVDLLKTVGDTNVLSNPRIRARNKEKAKILVGNRLPVVTSGTSATVGGAFSTSNVQYIDVGLKLEVQPTIRNDGNVAVKIELEVSSILKQINVPIGNGATTLAYEIGTRNASTVLELKDGETQVLAGLIQDSDQQSSTHIPGLGDIPVLGRLFGSHGTTREKNEVVLSITPRILRAQARGSSDATEFWYGSESQMRSGPFASVASPAPSAAVLGSGGVSFSPGPAQSAAAAMAPGPRPVPARIDAAAAPPPPPDAAPEPPSPDAKPRVSIEGPESAKVGDEISVSVRLASTGPVGRIRTQVAFDTTALQLVSADPGDLAGSAPKLETKPGGVQLDTSGGEGGSVSGGGTLVHLRLRAVAPRTAASISTQVVLVGEDGTAMAATQATPLHVAVTK